MLKLTQIPVNRMQNRGNLMQSRFWAMVKNEMGWQPYAFKIEWQQQHDTLLLFIQRPDRATSYCFAYIPWAPTFSVPEEIRGQFLEQVSQKLLPFLPAGCMFIRYDLPWESPYHSEPPPPDRMRELRMNFGTRQKNLRKAPTDIQPPDTRILDISKDKDQLLKDMRSKTRYNIRLARRKGVTVSDAEFSRIDEWYRMYAATAERNGISLHGYRNFKKLLEVEQNEYLPNTDIHLLIAEKDHQPLAGMILALHGSTATYLYGASYTERRNLMPTYRLQWEAIQLAQKHNCVYYDLFGIPPVEQKAHPMYGLYRFKTGFGGYSLHRQGCWDYPIDKDAYLKFAGQEPAGSSYHQR
ncbi:MAG: lipid II:glycine glycyltransferase FemX [Spirochaetota bacterium]